MTYQFESSVKITVVSIFYPPETGAAASRIEKMVASLQQRGADVEVITALPNYPTGKIFNGFKGKLLVKEFRNGIAVRRYWLYPSNSKKVLQRILNMLSFSLSIFLALPHLWCRRPDILIINSPPLLTGFSAVCLAKLARAKTVVNISDIWPLSAYELGVITKNRFYWFLEKIETFIYSSADACMAQSCQTVTHIQQHQPDKPVFLYRNLDAISPYIDQYPAHDSGRIKVIYAGLLGVAQGIYDICRNVPFAELGVELHIYGDGNERQDIEAYIRNSHACGIYYHGVLPKAEVARELSACHATLIPLASSIYGAFPSKIYMAIAAGLPIVYCGDGEGAELVEELSLGWVSGPSDYQQLSANLNALREQTPENYENMRKSIRMLARQRFNFDRHADKLATFIDQFQH